MIPWKCIHDIQFFEDASVNLVGVFKQLLDRTVLFLALHCFETFSGFNIAENLAVTAEFTFIKSDLQS